MSIKNLLGVHIPIYGTVGTGTDTVPRCYLLPVFLSFDVNPDPTFHFRGNGSQNLQGIESLTVVFKFDRNRFPLLLSDRLNRQNVMSHTVDP